MDNNEENNENDYDHIDQMRESSEDVRELLRRVLTLRDRTQQDIYNIENNLINVNLYDLLLSNSNFLFILLILIFMFKLEYLVLINKDLMNINILESDDMWLFYSLLFFTLGFVFWLVYLFVFKVFTGFEKPMIKEIDKDVNMSEMLYLNPFFFNMMVFYLDKRFIVASFDVFVVMVFSLKFLIVFIFYVFLYNHFKHKLNMTTNLGLDSLIIYKMRFAYSVLIFMTIATGYIITYFMQDASLFFVYIMHFKTLYVVLREVELWYSSEVSYKQINNYYATNEIFYLKSNLRKSSLKIVNLVSALLNL
jgi:hypothetical protein